MPLSQLVDSGYELIEKLQEHKGTGDRRADRFRRPRRDDVGLSEVGPRHRGRPPVDGEDEPRAEHCASLRPSRPGQDRRRVQPGNVEGAAVHAHAHVRGARRRAPVPRRVPRRAGLRRLVAAFARLHDAKVFIDDSPVGRHSRDASQGAPAQDGARSRHDRHRLSAADAGPRDVSRTASRSWRRSRDRSRFWPRNSKCRSSRSAS